MGSEVLSISLPSTTSVGEALSELLGKAMILSTELQDGVHKGLPEVAEFQVKVWILSERLDDWRVELWRSGVSNQHLWRNLRVAQDILTNLQKNLRSYLERWNRSAIPTLMHLLFVVNNILETGDARTQLQAGMAPDPISPRLSHGRDRIDLPVAGSSLETQDGPDDREGPSAVTIPRDLGMGLMEKAMLFTTQVQNRCYRRSAELAEFQKKVWLLSENDVQCGIRLGERPNSKHGHFLRALKVFETILENELRYIRNSSFRLRRRAFPRQLLYVLNEILKIVGIIARHNPPPLYFGPDGNYVPISRTIQEVREGLQDETAPNVLTVYGGPGCGKSSLVRYLAVSYQQKMRRVEAITPAIPSPQTVHFSDGVYFFTCGYRASQKVRQLQLEILNCLGSAAQPDDLTDAGKQEGGYVALSSYKRSMSSLLAQRNALIIFDDVWEPEAVKELVVPSMRVKYLITSQIKDICRLIRGPRATIGIQMPTLTEARQILSNFTEGLPRKGELPNSLENVADAVIGALECHPLSLATFGISIEISQATNASYWEARRRFYLDRNIFHSFPHEASTSVHEPQRLIVDDREGGTSPDHRQKFTLVGHCEAGWGLDIASSLRDHMDGIGSPAHSEGSCSPDFGGWRPTRTYGP